METTNTPNSQHKVVATKTVMKTKKVLVSKGVFFSIFVVIFALAAFFMFCLDKENFLRKQFNAKFLNSIADFFSGTLKINFDVTMMTWITFFLFVIVFFAVFTTFFFKKNILQKKEAKQIRKKGEPLSAKQKVTFNVVYFILAGLLMAGLILLILLVLVPNLPLPAAQKNASFIGHNLLTNTLPTIGIVMLLVAIFPAACLVLFCLFKVIVFLISLIVSGVSKSVMQSEEYQESMAATQAAAADIASSMAEAKGLSGDALARAKDAQKNGQKKNSMAGFNIFPALDNIDKKYEEIEAKKAEEEAAKAQAEADRQAAIERGEEVPEIPEQEVVEEPKEITYEEFTQFAYEFQSYLCHQKYYFDLTIIRSFIAGLASSRMILLQGLSGTGKTTLPRVFLEYIGSKAWFFPVQATWRDRSDVTGYFSEFANEFKETEFLKHLYEASYTPDKVNLLVLDEMNISRVEYYFADFLSIFEYPSADWLVPLIQIHDDVVMPKKLEGGMARIPTNTWFIGTVNIDDSTFTITDKVYDRVIAIDFEELNIPFESDYPYDPHPLKCGELEKMFAECRAHEENKLSDEEKLKFLKLAAFTADTFDVKFGNRIMNQIENFVPVFVALGGTKEQALDLMFANKILRKLNGKFESYIKDGLVKLTRYLNTEYGKGVFLKTEKLVNLISKKLA
ncbi:MAG: hypothetical protein KBS97_01440 [Firmicutes bacterium]|nr:hypothetical protein [Candidatus Fiminaster equi]